MNKTSQAPEATISEQFNDLLESFKGTRDLAEKQAALSEMSALAATVSLSNSQTRALEGAHDRLQRQARATGEMTTDATITAGVSISHLRAIQETLAAVDPQTLSALEGLTANSTSYSTPERAEVEQKDRGGRA